MGDRSSTKGFGQEKRATVSHSRAQLLEQEELEAEALAEALAAPLIGRNGEDRSAPAPREGSGAGRRDYVGASLQEAEEDVPPVSAACAAHATRHSVCLSFVDLDGDTSISPLPK